MRYARKEVWPKHLGVRRRKNVQSVCGGGGAPSGKASFLFAIISLIHWAPMRSQPPCQVLGCKDERGPGIRGHLSNGAEQ